MSGNVIANPINAVASPMVVTVTMMTLHKTMAFGLRVTANKDVSKAGRKSARSDHHRQRDRSHQKGEDGKYAADKRADGEERQPVERKERLVDQVGNGQHLMGEVDDVEQCRRPHPDNEKERQCQPGAEDATGGNAPSPKCRAD